MAPTIFLQQLPAFISTGITLAFACYLLIYRPGRNWGYTLVISLLIAIWCSGQYFWVTAQTPDELVLIAKYQYVGILLLPAFWTIFAMVEANKWRGLSPWNLLLFVIPLLCMYWCFTYTPGKNSYLWHGMTLESAIGKVVYGPLFWLMVVHNYLLIAVGSLILYAHYVQSPYYRLQLLATVAIPVALLIVNSLFLSGNWPLQLDPTPTGFAIGYCFLGWAIYRGQFLKLSPMSRNIALDSIEDGVFILDDSHRIVDLNPAALRIGGRTGRDVLGKTLNQLWPTLEESLDTELPKQVSWTNEQILEISGSDINDPSGKSRGKVIVFRNVTRLVQTHRLLIETQDALQHANRELDKIAHTDELTGLANRRMLLLRLEDEIARSKRKYEPLAVLFIDLDHFKKINDKYGHLVGDEVLRRAAEKLMDHRRGFDIAARYGGEELVLVLTETHLQGAQAVANRLWNELRALSHSVNNESFQVTASIGIAMLAPQDNTKSIIDRADQALYHAKRKGRDCICIATDSNFEISV